MYMHALDNNYCYMHADLFKFVLPSYTGSAEDSLMILPSSTHSNKQFNVDELGLSWDTIENRQAFLFPRKCICDKP